MKKVIIIGAGIAGLTAGIYARRSGFDVKTLESHNIPGGNSTSWRRGGYLFEGGMHWLIGSKPNSGMHRLWQETGALQENTPIHLRDPFLTYYGGDKPICLYRDPKKLEQHLLAISPEDKKAIHTLIRDLKALGQMSVPIWDLKGLQVVQKSPSMLAMLPGMLRAIPKMKRLRTMDAGTYANQFRHPGIRAVLHNVVGADSFVAMAIASTLGSLSCGDGGYPEGGSLRMAQNIANTFTALGGVIEYGTRAERVWLENGKACGVVANGVLQKADAVIVTQDTLTAMNTLFESPLHESWTAQMQQTKVVNCTFLSFGVRADLCDLPEAMLFPLEKPLIYGGVECRHIGFYNYANMPGYAPDGCAAMTCVLMGADTYNEWAQAKQDGTYTAKKQALAEQVIALLAQAIPRTRGAVEVWDVATPLTYERYCNTYHGSWMSVMDTDMKRQLYPCKAESAQNLYFAGQRQMLPGGLPTAAATGRQAAQYLCLDHNTVFRSN